MKKGRMLAVFGVLVAVVPAVALLGPRGTAQPSALQPAAAAAQDEPAAPGTFRVLDESTGQVLELSEGEYVLGALLCEMPASWEVEALKAQAVAIRSYALYVKKMAELHPDEALKGAHFAVNTATLTGYMDEADAKRLFGEEFNVYYNKAKGAVDSVLEYALLSDGEPICACYHAISGGRTEASENVFAAALSYLVPVDSAHDAAAQGYLSTAVFPPYDLADILSAEASFAAVGEPETWLGEREVSASGTVLRQDICGASFTGVQLRELLGLRSAVFDLHYDEPNGQFVFTVRGYGHGVGMSQHGANALAEQGKSFEDILAHYYTGAQLAVYPAR